MKQLIKIIPILIFLAVIACKEAEFDRTAMLTNIAKTAIIPAFEDFKSESLTLTELLHKLQTDYNETSLKAARDQWIRTAVAWHSCELFKIGKYRDSYIPNRIYSTPPKMTYVDRILESDEVIDKKLIQEKGSNIVGLPAMEYLLFGGERTLKSLKDSKRRMTYLMALGESLQERAAKSAELWKLDGETCTQLITSQGTDLSSGISMLFNQMITLTEKIMMSRLGKPLGKQTEGRKDIEMLEAFKSEQSIQFIKTSLASVKQTFTGGEGSGFDDYLNFLERKQQEKLTPKILAAFKTIEETAGKISSLEKDLTENTASVEKLYSDIKALLVLLKVDAANKLAITVTFNDNDGD